MIESTIERKLVKKGKDAGIKFLKFKTPSRRHVPDRIAFLDNAVTIFVECKRPGEELRPGQDHYAKQLEKKGFKVFRLDSIEDVEKVIKESKRLSEEGR